MLVAMKASPVLEESSKNDTQRLQHESRLGIEQNFNKGICRGLGECRDEQLMRKKIADFGCAGQAYFCV